MKNNNAEPDARRPLTATVQILFVLSLLWSALYLAWVSLSAADFLYPVWYEVLDIGEHIERYGPENRYKHGFEATERSERLALFAGIAEAINQGGRGLAELEYTDARGRQVPLLRPPERIHLQSVARLIDRLRVASYVLLVVLVASVVGMRLLSLPLPSGRRVLIGTVAGLGAASVTVLALGPERVFNTLHTWIFPKGEQWFFYYQESLMTTLMKAPDLFGAIAVALVVVALAWLAVLLFGVRWLLAGR